MAARSVFFVAPLPPPVTGFSLVNERMLAAFGALGDILVADRAASSRPGPLRHLDDVLILLRQVCRLQWRCLRRKDDVVYVALSGGFRQLGDLLFLIVARAAGRPTLVHHHSFNYLLAPTRLTRLLLGFERRSLHLALCETMKRQLVDVYGIASERILVLPNAAFVDPAPAAPQRSPGEAPVLGFLSNITAEKGIFLYFDLVQRCLASGFPVRGRIAGPVEASIRREFERRLAEIPAIDYLGPVYGEHKSAFLASIDLLVFPSRYANEASPVTILEAAAAGVPTLATRRGCIPEMLAGLAGDALAEDAFVEEAYRSLQRLTQSPGELVRMKTEVAALFRGQRASAAADLSDLVTRLRR